VTILVTGAGGFIGGHLVSKLLNQGQDVRAVDIKPVNQWDQVFQVENIVADLRDKSECYHVCNHMTRVYNLAANVGGIKFIKSHKAECMQNVLINTHLLQAARDKNVEKYFFASSACVYDLDKQQADDSAPLKEEDAYPANPENGYGWEKLFSERMCINFAEDYGLQARVARLHNVYGTHCIWRGGREKAPAELCRKVALAGDDPIEIWGDGRQIRSYMWVDDTLEAIDRLMCKDINEPINIGSTEAVTVNELVSIIEEVAGVQCEKTYAPSEPTGVRVRNCDDSKAESVLEWKPSTTLKEGISKLYPWIESQIQS